MEFMQFHPTVLYIAGSARHLLTEALRGEGAYLRDRNGHRFMPDYHPLAELAPRDDVSRAITAQMAKTQHPSVYLDLSHLDPAYIREPVPRHRPALPRLRPRHHPRPDPGPPRRPLHDRRRDRRPRRPDHAPRPLGRGRGHQLRPPRRQPARLEQPARRARLRRPRRRGHRRTPRRRRARTASKSRRSPPAVARDGHEPLDLADIRDSLRALMWRSVGITRDAQGLAEAAEQVDFWCRYVLGHVFHDPAGWTMQNMLTVARLMIAAAIAREESRGVHTRRDFPDTDPAWAATSPWSCRALELDGRRAWIPRAEPPRWSPDTSRTVYHADSAPRARLGTHRHLRPRHRRVEPAGLGDDPGDEPGELARVGSGGRGRASRRSSGLRAAWSLAEDVGIVVAAGRLRGGRRGGSPRGGRRRTRCRCTPRSGSPTSRGSSRRRARRPRGRRPGR